MFLDIPYPLLYIIFLLASSAYPYYLFLNTYKNSVNVTAELYHDSKYSKSREHKFNLYNPLTDEKTPLDGRVEIKNGRAVLDLTLHPFEVIIITAQQ